MKLNRFTVTIFLTLLTFAGVIDAIKAEEKPDTARAAANAVSSLDVGEGLEATLFASEPMVGSPSNIAIDYRGRVWVCEVVNYRRRKGTRPKGDRILVLEDTDGDSKADKSTVFYQGTDIDSAVGICVLGNRVIVSCSPNVFVFTFDDETLQVEKKQVLFTKIGQPQHDHSAHAFTYGPDGKLYWNFGNTGKAVHDAKGNPVVDMAGNKVVDNGKPYFGGMVFRCNMDGSEFEVLGHNFRNNYEVAVDSFGTIWQSDNDDDGNQGVRINYVMPFGNFGYRDEMTGAGWRVPRIGMDPEIPKRHWHLNDPGVVPNLLQTGGGSPTGILIYEGKLLPKVFWNQIIHADAGPNIVRAYPAEKAGAGYSARSIPILHGARDQWFRPSDVCVAPDGSLFIADWYDPGVGGHRMGDIERGRIYRIAPPKNSYKVRKVSLNSLFGAMSSLTNPNIDARYRVEKAILRSPKKAERFLKNSFDRSDDARFRARLLWLMGRIKGRGERYVKLALRDENPDIRITGLRLAQLNRLDVISFIAQLQNDPSPQVRRECALLLRHHKSPRAAKLWASLATKHDGKDRWYLEALGIGAHGQWDSFLQAWLSLVGDDWNSPAGRDVLWRSRAIDTPAYLAKIIADSSISDDSLPRYLRAFDFLEGPQKQAALVQLAFGPPIGDSKRQMLIAAEAVSRLKDFDVHAKPETLSRLGEILDAVSGTKRFVEFVGRFDIAERYPELLTLAQKNSTNEMGIEAIRTLLAKQQNQLVSNALADKEETLAIATARVLGSSADEKAVGFLLPVVNETDERIELRRQATAGLAKSRNGALKLVELAKTKQLDARLKESAAAALHAATWNDVKQQAIELFPLPPSKNNKALPPLRQLVGQKGNAEKGRTVFGTTGTCAKCHVVNGEGKQVGPNLSEIGAKLSRQAFFESILFPSSGISHNYESSAIALNNGNVLQGIITSRTDDSVTLTDAEAIVRTFKTSEIDEIKKQSVSLMPADLSKTMTAEELVNVVEYLATLKKAKKQK